MSLVRESLLEQFQRLDENLLTSEFTFGFELEAVSEYGSSNCDTITDDTDDIDDMLENERNLIDSYLFSSGRRNEIKGKSHIHQDSSVNSGYEEDGEEYNNDDDICFEYSSPIIPCTPFWFNKTMETLKTLLRSGVYTNYSCGFHHHLHFKGMTERDMVWIYCNMASDESFEQNFKEFDTLHGTYTFTHTDWARFSPLTDLGVALKSQNWKEALNLLNTNKWRAFRIHPQGTLEWRGPRDFLNDGDINTIKEFYKKFNDLIAFIKRYMKANTLTGATNITKEALFNGLTSAIPSLSRKPDLEFLSHTADYDARAKIKYQVKHKKYNITKESITKVINRIEAKPSVVFFFIKNDEAREVLKSIFTSMYHHQKMSVIQRLSTDDDFIKDNRLKTLGTELISIILDSESDNDYRNEMIEYFVTSPLGKYVDPNEYVKIVKKSSNFKSLFASIKNLARKHIPLSLRVVELGISSIMNRNVNYKEYEFVNTLLSPYFMRLFGPKNVMKLLVFFVKRYSRDALRLKEDVLWVNKVIDFVKNTNNVDMWDDLVRKLMSNNAGLFILLVNRPKERELIKIISKDIALARFLNDKELKYLEKIGV